PILAIVTTDARAPTRCRRRRGRSGRFSEPLRHLHSVAEHVWALSASQWACRVWPGSMEWDDNFAASEWAPIIGINAPRSCRIKSRWPYPSVVRPRVQDSHRKFL